MIIYRKHICFSVHVKHFYRIVCCSCTDRHYRRL